MLLNICWVIHTELSVHLLAVAYTQGLGYRAAHRHELPENKAAYAHLKARQTCFS